MDYGIYKNVRDASWQCLIDCSVSALPVRPVQIALHYGVECLDYAPLLQSGESGKIIRRTDSRVQIMLNPNQPAPRKRFTILHELGHYLLGHLGDEPLPRSYSTITQPEEYAAERFAVGVLMPACVLWGLQAFDSDAIAALCNVSQSAAQRRSERMQILRERDKFLTSPLERQVYQQFQDFIRSTKFDKDITI